MVFEGHSNLIQAVETIEIRGTYAESLNFYSGMALVIGQKTIALYKNVPSIHDELGNGLISMATIPDQYTLDIDETPWVCEHQSGFVGFGNGLALLILPNAIRLYESKKQALKNSNVLSELTFT